MKKNKRKNVKKYTKGVIKNNYGDDSEADGDSYNDGDVDSQSPNRELFRKNFKSNKSKKKKKSKPEFRKRIGFTKDKTKTKPFSKSNSKSLDHISNGLAFKSSRGKIISKNDVEKFKGIKKDIKWFLSLNKIKTTSGGRKIIHELLKDLVFKLLNSLKGNNDKVLNKNEIADKIVYTYDDIINRN